MSASSGSSVSARGRAGRGWAPSTSKTALTPTSLIKKYPLPLAAYFHTPETPPGLDVSRPLLLYNNYTSTKVRAASLRVIRDGGLYPVGPSLVIPDSYTGWFSVVTSEGRSAPYHTTIEQVAGAQTPFFLTRFDIPAYVKVVDETDSTRMTYHRTVVQSGHVLKLLGIFEDLNARRYSSGSGRARSDSNSFAPCNKYIQCLNYCNEVIFVPFSATGRFYETAHRGTRSVNHVFLMSQLLNTFQLPLTVRLVCGFMPRVPQAFTGILRLEKAQKEAVILACTMTSEARATLLEMDVSSNFILSPITDPIFAKSPIYLKTVSYCADEADSWRRQIKVTHHVTEDSSGSSLGRSSSDKTFESTSSKGLNIPFFSDFERRKGRGRERSRTRDFLFREKSRDFKVRDKSKDKKRAFEKNKENQEFKDLRGRDKSRDNRIKDRVKEKIQDMSRNQHCVVSGEFISIRVDDKLNGKKVSDNRKVSKQNTYIFQNERASKYQDKRKTASRNEELPPRSVESQDYATVLDDISPIKEDVEIESHDGQYAEICDHKIVSDSRSGIVRADKRETGKYWRTHLSDMRTYSSTSSAEEDNPYSFTLLKKDIGKCYDKLPGLGFGDSSRFRQRKADPAVC